MERLLGLSLSEEELINALNRLKGELEGVEGDEVIFEVTHDRPDLFSVEGISRMLKGLLEVELGLQRINLEPSGVKLIVHDVPHRPYIMMGIVKDLSLDDEAIRQMIQLQEKIHLTYGRNRRKLAIGFYDADKLRPPLTYKLEPVDSVKYVPLGEGRSMSGEEVLRFTEKGKLYGVYALRNNEVPVIRDSEGRPLVIVPVLGSEEFKVDSSTRNVLIDVTSVDMKLGLNILRVVTCNLLERSRDASVGTVDVEYSWGILRTPDLSPTKVVLSVDFINDYLGIKLTRDAAVRYLLMSRHGVEDHGDLVVSVAPYRINVLHPVDLVEDVALAMGYSEIPREVPRQGVAGSRHPLERLSRLIRELMIGMGFQEVLNYMLTSKEVMEITGEEVLEVENPKSELYSVVRNHIWPQLLDVARDNKSSVAGGLRIFEVGDTVVPRGGKIIEDRVLSYLIIGPGTTLTNGLAVNKSLMSKLSMTPSLRPCSVNGGIPGRTACITVSGTDVGFIMEVNPDVILMFGLDQPAVVSELSITKIMETRGG